MKYILYIVLFLPCLLFGQGRNNLWLSGYNSGGGSGFGGTNIEFNASQPNIYQHNRPMNITESFASITDTSGDLLFYSNGCYIANRNDDTLLNGTVFNTGSVTTAYCSNGIPINQGVLIIPSPDHFDDYYVFSLSAEPVSNSVQPLHLSCTLVDMSLDNGLGGAVWKDSIVIADTLSMGLLTACKHGNGRDWWVMIPEYHSNCYYSILLSPIGISLFAKQCSNQPTGDNDWSGQAVFSPDGTKYARYDKDNGLMIFDFDRCTGSMSNPLFLLINDSAQCGGVAFSPNSQYLYVSSWRYLYQFDMLATNILSSKTTVAVYDGFMSPLSTTFYLSQLAPDGKIYLISNNGTNVLHKINSPNNLGLACDVQQHSVSLPTYNALTIPNHPNYFLWESIGSICDSLSTSISELNDLTSFTLYPNPTKDLLYVKSLAASDYTFIILNALNQEILKLKSNAMVTVIDLKEYSKGLYYLLIQNNKFCMSKIIVKE